MMMNSTFSGLRAILTMLTLCAVCALALCQSTKVDRTADLYAKAYLQTPTPKPSISIPINYEIVYDFSAKTNIVAVTTPLYTIPTRFCTLHIDALAGTTYGGSAMKAVGGSTLDASFSLSKFGPSLAGLTFDVGVGEIVASGQKMHVVGFLGLTGKLGTF